MLQGGQAISAHHQPQPVASGVLGGIPAGTLGEDPLAGPFIDEGMVDPPAGLVFPRAFHQLVLLQLDLPDRFGLPPGDPASFRGGHIGSRRFFRQHLPETKKFAGGLEINPGFLNLPFLEMPHHPPVRGEQALGDHGPEGRNPASLQLDEGLHLLFDAELYGLAEILGAPALGFGQPPRGLKRLGTVHAQVQLHQRKCFGKVKVDEDRGGDGQGHQQNPERNPENRPAEQWPQRGHR